MTFLSLLRDNENLSGDMLARIIGSGGGALGNIYDAPLPPGIGTGSFTVGCVGKMSGPAGADPNHFSVQANGTTLVLTVRPGWIWIRRDSGSVSLDPRCVYVEMTAAQTVTLAANNQGSTRVDQICLRYDLTTPPDATGSNIPSLFVVQGGAASALGAAPADAGTGALYVVLATVTIANAAPSVSQGNVADKRYVHPSQAKVRAHRSSDIVVTTGTFVMDTVDDDPAAMYSNTTGTYTVMTPGFYLVAWGMWIVTTAASGAAQTTTRIASGDSFPGAIQNLAANSNGEFVAGGLIKLSVGAAVGPGSPGGLSATATLKGDARYSYFSLVFQSFG